MEQLLAQTRTKLLEALETAELIPDADARDMVVRSINHACKDLECVASCEIYMEVSLPEGEE